VETLEAPPTATFNTLPKQTEFIRSDAPEVLYSGAFGAGKSLALCLKLFLRASQPGAREALIRAYSVDLEKTTLKTLIEGDGDTPPVLQPGTYIHRVQKKEIQLAEGGTILLFGLDMHRDKDFKRIGSLNLTGAAIDECEEIPERAWLKLTGRIRVKHPTLTRQIYGVCNPGAPSHHLAGRFGIRTGTKPIEIGGRRVHLIQTNTLENPHLPPDYIARLQVYKGVLYQRMVLGRWVGNEGAVYDRWNRDLHVAVHEGGFIRTWLAIDDGYHNPCCFLLVGEDSDGRLHVIREFYKTEVNEPEQVNQVKLMEAQAPAPLEGIVIDPSAAKLKGALRKEGFSVIDGDNAVLDGINAVHPYLDIAGDGRPRLTADPSCENFSMEMEAYRWDPESSKDKPIKEHDHAPDALRYLAMHLHKPAPVVFTADDLKHIKTRMETIPVEEAGIIDFYLDDPVKRALGIGRAEFGKVLFRVPKKGAAPLRLWHERTEEGPKGIPRRDRRYVLFAQVGAGASPSLILVGDVDGRELVAAWEKMASVEEVAETVALLGLWYGAEQRATVGWLKWGPASALVTALRRFKHFRQWIPVDQEEPGWDPQPEELGQACMEMRDVLANGSFVVPVPEVYRDAKAYLWNAGGGVEHASTVGDKEAQAGHTDYLRGTIGLWRVMRTVQGERSKVLAKMRG